MIEIYTPINAGTISLSVTSTGVQGTLAPLESANRLVISNVGDFPAYFRTGVGAQTALTTDFCIPAGECFVMPFPSTYTGIAAICDSLATTTLKVSQMYVSQR